VVSEALANAARHARASAVEVEAEVVGKNLRLQVHDDGVGGADAAQGSGLTALTDRVEAVGGRMEISSPAGSGTNVLVAIPLGSS
jgi:signal transduction histidine kinase